MREITRILCPTDFSAASRHAAGYAIALARWYGARITGLYAHTPMFRPLPVFEMAGYPSEPPYPQVDLTPFIDDVRDTLRGADAAHVEVEVAVASGNPVREILDRARELPADLIVMGTHGAGGFEHLVLGSVSEKVLRQARCPVLTVPPRSRTAATVPFKRILCPVDFSDLSPAIVEFAGSLAREGDADVTLLHVLEWPDDEEPRTLRSFSVPEYPQYREQDANAHLKALVSDALRDGCRVETRLVHGKPYREILGVAADLSAEVIVMGVHGRNPLDVMLFGSTTNQVVRRAHCPVLTLRQ